MSAKLEPTPQPCATVRPHEDEIRSVEVPVCLRQQQVVP